MNYNYHTHTYRCGHAVGTPEEYILRAIAGKIEYMGFSDHMPHIYKDGTEAGFRVPVAQAYEYVDELRVLREKYKDRIDILIGFEMEYFRDTFPQMLRNAVNYGGEYLIYGGHYLEECQTTYSGNPTSDPAYVTKYADTVVEAINTGAFTYIAHPDMITFLGDTKHYADEMRKICIASKEKGIPLEINFLGIRTNRVYPNEIFWKIAGEEGSPVTFGFDAHDPDAAYDGVSLTRANELVEKFELNYIGKPQIIKITELI